MAINKLNVGLIDNVSATGNTQVSDGHVLTYVAANNAVEFKNLDLSISGTGTVSSNIESVNTSVTGDIDTVQDNISSTTTLVTSTETNIDTVQSNLDTFATYANTNYASDSANSFSTITVSDANLVATSSSDNLTFISGNGISISANAAAQSLTFDVYAGNIKSDYFVLDGTANTCTLSTSDRPNTSIYVTVGGLIQEAGINYVVDGETLTLINTYPIINGTDVEVRYLPYTGEIAASTPTGPTLGYQGESFGYASGGTAPPNIDTMQKYPYTSDTPSTDVGELTQASSNRAGNSSSTNGYDVAYSFLNRFPFSSDTPATALTGTTFGGGAHASSTSDTHGYGLGGSPTPNRNGQMFKFSFTDESFTNIGEDSTFNQALGMSGASSTTHGYVRGGEPNPTFSDKISKYPFSSDQFATDVGELAEKSNFGCAQNSLTHGYLTAGDAYYDHPNARSTDVIQKHAFTSDSSATEIGQLTVKTGFACGGSSSATHGYSQGGRGSPTHSLNTRQSTIEKFPFSSDSNATDVGELLQAANGITGNQV